MPLSIYALILCTMYLFLSVYLSPLYSLEIQFTRNMYSVNYVITIAYLKYYPEQKRDIEYEGDKFCRKFTSIAEH